MSAASVAFHWFLAIFPTAVASIAVVNLIGLSPSQLRSVVHGAGVLLPAQVAQILDQALSSPSGRTGGIVAAIAGVAVALWSAIEAMAALQVSLDVAYEVQKRRSFLLRRAMALPLIVFTVVLGGAASGLLVLGDPIRSLLPSSVALARPAFNIAWGVLRWAGATTLVILLLSAYYTLGPNRSRARWHPISAGAVAAAIGWICASGLFSFYLDHFGHESRTYGTFAGVAVLLLWLFVTATAVLLGAELNSELDRMNRTPAHER